MNGATLLALETGEALSAESRAQEATELNQALDDVWGTAHARFLLGHVFAEKGDFAEAKQLFKESASRFEQLHDEHHALLATRSLAWTYAELGDRERAHALREDNLRRARAEGDRPMEARSLGALVLCS